MAFSSAAGYANLPNGVWSPAIYSQKVLLTLKKQVVADEITNPEFSGEINRFGDTVKIIKQPTVTGGTYVRGQQLVSQDVEDEDVTLTIDQSQYYQFQFDDIESKMSHVNYMNLCVDAGADYLKQTYDSNILDYIFANVDSGNIVLNGAGTASSSAAPATVGFGANDYTPLDLISNLAVILSEDNVPSSGRWLVASPRFFEALRREDSKLIEASVTGEATSMVLNGKKPYQLHGFTLYESNNNPVDSTKVTVTAGHKGATATAISMLKNETLRSERTFADINRSLMVWGRKVIRPTALARATITIGDV